MPQPAPATQPRIPEQLPSPKAPVAEENLFDLYPATGPDAARFQRLASEARAARGSDAAAQSRFTEGLIAVILAEHDPLGRCRIVSLAGSFDTPAASAICTGALQDPDSRVRIVACQVCGTRADAEALTALGRCLAQDRDPVVRRRACAALGGKRDEPALAALRRAVTDSDPVVRALASRAIAARPQDSPAEARPRSATNPTPATPPAAPPGGRF
jgi:HEAT repeat protein